MELTCEAVAEDCSNNCWEEFDTDLEMSQPRIVNVTSLSNSHISEHNSSPIFPTDVFPSAEECSLTSPVSEMPLMCNTDCYVRLERLPESLVQAAQMCKLYVSENTALLNSVGVNKTMAMPTFVLLDADEVKIEPDERDTVFADEQASVAHLTTQQHSVIVKSSVNMPVVTDVATMTDVGPPSDAVTSLAASRRSYRVEQDISVILLDSAQLPKTSASHATDTSVAQPHDVSRLVLSMLQQQNINLLPVRDNKCVSSVMQNENEQRGQMQGGSPCVASDAAILRQMLENANRAKAALEVQLKAEQAKVKYLIAENTSLKDTVKRLSTERNNVECTRDGNSDMEC